MSEAIEHGLYALSGLALGWMGACWLTTPCRKPRRDFLQCAACHKPGEFYAGDGILLCSRCYAERAHANHL